MAIRIKLAIGKWEIFCINLINYITIFSFDVTPTNVGGGNNNRADASYVSSADNFGVSNDRLPVGTIPLFATSSPEYETSLNKVISSANQVYQDFLNSNEGLGFCGQICLVGDSVGSILAYDALCRENFLKRTSSDTSMGGTATTGGIPSDGGTEGYSTTASITIQPPVNYRVPGVTTEMVDSETSSQFDEDHQRQHAQQHQQQSHNSPNGKGILIFCLNRLVSGSN